MKIVIFIDWFAPAYKGGGPIQSVVNLVNYPIYGNEYRIICSNKDLDGVPLVGVGYDQWIQFNETTKVWYCSRNKKVAKAVKEVAKLDVDIFYINGIYSLFYNFLPLLFGKARKKIISVRGMLHPGALSQKRRKKTIYLTIWKMLGLHRKFFFHATNSEEGKFIKQYFGPSVQVYVAPNLPKVLKTMPYPLRKEKHLQLVSIGLISPMKNYMEVLRALGQCEEEIRYDIYGPVKDFSYWLKCNEVIKSLPGNISVQYKGEIPPTKVFEVLNSAQVFILPSKSENFGHAIFEAFTAGRPVITSHNTPWNNLQEAKAGFNVTPENLNELSSAISFFANADNITLAQWSEGAKKYSERAIDLRFITDQYKNMFSVRT